MNTVAILPEILMSLLQKQNVKRDIVEKIEVENQPRWDSIKWYCDSIEIDFESTIKIINAIPKLFPL